MFKENNQPKLFSFELELSDEQQKLLNKTPEKAFHNLIFRNINENDYKVLYSEKFSRPNAPVNVLVGAMVLKERKGWSFDELMESIQFDLRTKVALGLQDLNDKPFGRKTIFNFQNRLSNYEESTGINLLEKTFDNLTAKQLEELKLKTNIQRTDSTLMSSNIKKYSRVSLLVEVLLRLWNVLDDTDKEILSARIEPYAKLGSQKYVYTLKSSDLTHELEKLGELYHLLYQNTKDSYSDKEEFITFERAYKEHFTVVETQVEVKEGKDLGSNILQSPDDVDATYRKKRDQESKGYVLNAVETAHPENDLQLLTDIVVEKNNVDDSTIIESRIDNLCEKTPDLDELHTDGGFGSEGVDKKMEENEIILVTTAIKGRQSAVEIIIDQDQDQTQAEQYTVSCPEQKVESEPTRKRNKATFDINKCVDCPLNEKCSIFKTQGKYYFDHSDYLRSKRARNILNIPEERRKIRPNVEATMKEFKGKTNNAKLKVRGLFKTSLFAFAMGISINFGRIYRYMAKNDTNKGVLSDFSHFFRLLVLSSEFSARNTKRYSQQTRYFLNIAQ